MNSQSGHSEKLKRDDQAVLLPGKSEGLLEFKRDNSSYQLDLQNLQPILEKHPYQSKSIFTAKSSHASFTNLSHNPTSALIDQTPTARSLPQRSRSDCSRYSLKSDSKPPSLTQKRWIASQVRQLQKKDISKYKTVLKNDTITLPKLNSNILHKSTLHCAHSNLNNFNSVR